MILSPDEVARLEVMVDEGRGYDWIARKLGRSREAVMLKAARIGHRVMTTAATLSARDVALLLGLGCSKTVVRWVREYGLPGRNAGRKDRPLWRIAPSDLVAWLERPEHWMKYDPRLIAAPELRDRLQRLRQLVDLRGGPSELHPALRAPTPGQLQSQHASGGHPTAQLRNGAQVCEVGRVQLSASAPLPDPGRQSLRAAPALRRRVRGAGGPLPPGRPAGQLPAD